VTEQDAALNAGLLTFATRDDAAAALAAEVCETLTEALAARGRATLVVSGGTSPVGFFHRLRRLPLSWERITVIPSDERVVALQHPDRNESMIRRELLQGAAAAARLIPLIPPGPVPRHFDEVVLGFLKENLRAEPGTSDPPAPRKVEASVD